MGRDLLTISSTLRRLLRTQACHDQLRLPVYSEGNGLDVRAHRVCTAAGKAFDFRADVMLLIGGLLVLFAVFLAPTVLRIQLAKGAKNVLLIVAGLIIAYGIILTVQPTWWTPFAAKFIMPKIGWAGVFKVAIVFDSIAAVLAFFVLRRLKAPVLQAEPDVAPSEPRPSAVRA